MEKWVEEELSILKKTILDTLPVEQIHLFGSYASGNPHEDSDLDILVIIPDDSNIKEIDAVKKIQKAIRNKKTIPVDIIVSKKTNFTKRELAPTIEREIANEGLILYG